MAEKLAREPPRVGVPIIDAKFGTEATTLLEKYHSITMVLIPWYFGAVYFTVVLNTVVKYILPWYLVPW